ncbi:hypothetical protein [Virgisporangium aurantiacum]|nr:hypothetical protein [Virgisporangium aurantiacum]
MNLGKIAAIARKLLKDTPTDTDPRRPPAQGRDVISGWGDRPRVPGSTQDRTF